MTGLLYPKPGRKKKRRKHKESILQRKNGTCYLCMHLKSDYSYHWYLEEHHIFGGPNRPISEAEGLKVFLCQDCHTGKDGVHRDINKMRFLQQEGQRKYEETHSRAQFMKLFGRNYLED